MFGEDVEDEQFGEFCGGNGVVCRNENGLLGESVYNDEDSGVTGRLGEFLDEIHGDGIPREFRNRELLELAIRTMSLGFGPKASGTGFTVVLDESP
jgi:hypothetical protein